MRTRSTYLILGFLLLLWGNGATASLLMLYTENYPPYSITDSSGRIDGPAVKKVEEIMHRARIEFVIQSLPWARAYAYAKQSENACVFSAVRLPEREGDFFWIGPIFESYQMAIFGRADDTRKPKGLDELHGTVLGSYSKSAVGEYLKANGFNVDFSSNDFLNPQKLLLHRFDYWAADKSHGLALLRQQGLSNKIVPVMEFKRSEMYLACNAKMSHARLGSFQRAWISMQHDGTNAKIEQQYFR